MRLLSLATSATAPVAIAALLLGTVTAPAHAHHGWDDFDTDRLYYLSGSVSEVRWGEPHSFFTVTVDEDMPSDTPQLTLPEELQAPEDSAPIEVAPSYDGPHDALDVVIAPPSFTGPWGLDRPLRDGEQVELVGYVGRSHDDEFRPVAFWYDQGTPVNQVLGTELPTTPLPVPYPEVDAGSDAEADGATGSTESEDSSPVVVWSGLAVGLVVLVAGGAAYLRRRSAST